jgi:hypothetical protein
VALVLVLLTTSFVGVLGGGLVLLASTELLISSHFRETVQVRSAAAAAAELVVTDLAAMADWTPALSGGVRAGFVDVTEAPTLVDGTVLDLVAETTSLQARSDARGGWGADRPRWALFAFGPASRLLPSGHPLGSLYLIVWIADDGGDGDGDPAVDVNGIVQMTADAVGPRGRRQSVTALYGRVPAAPGVVRGLAWRAGP